MELFRLGNILKIKSSHQTDTTKSPLELSHMQVDGQHSAIHFREELNGRTKDGLQDNKLKISFKSRFIFVNYTCQRRNGNVIWHFDLFNQNLSAHLDSYIFSIPLTSHPETTNWFSEAGEENMCSCQILQVRCENQTHNLQGAHSTIK